MYGIRNIGNSLEIWKNDFETIYKLISSTKRNSFPKKFVQFLGFTIYGAKPYDSGKNPYRLADAHYSYVRKIPDFIKDHIRKENRSYLDEDTLIKPIGGTAVMHTHSTFPSMAQALHVPMWKAPDEYERIKNQDEQYLIANHIKINRGSYGKYRDTLGKYKDFAQDFLVRVEKLDSEV